MSDDQKSRFEPPPWEQEAFERFREAQDAQRSQAELETALRTVREKSEQQAPAERAAPAAAEPGPPIPEAEIDSMIIQLRGEERPMPRASIAFINGVIAFMCLSGVYIIVRSALLLRNVQVASTVGTVLAATLSFMVFATGIGFLGGAFLLFRKYHR